MQDLAQKCESSYRTLLERIQCLLLARSESTTCEVEWGRDAIVKELEKFCERYDYFARERETLRAECENLRADLRTTNNALQSLKQHVIIL